MPKTIQWQEGHIGVRRLFRGRVQISLSGHASYFAFQLTEAEARALARDLLAVAAESEPDA